MKKFQWIGLVMAFALVLLAGCNQAEEPGDQSTEQQEDTQTPSGERTKLQKKIKRMKS